ncbi:MAG: TM2 domain-containing protein [Actinomycetia bacterium]|nr:TM2 domain-containing protein [Actinomycetes bacterium]
MNVSDLSPMVASALGKLTEEQRAQVEHEYLRKRRSVSAMVALAILFPIQLFLLGKTGLGGAFLLTGAGFGVWWVVEWFFTPSRVRDYNNELATNIVRNLKLLGN